MPGIERYSVRTVAVLPFQTLDTPQVPDQPVHDLGAPTSVKRSDIEFAIPPSGEKLNQPTVTTPPQAGEKVTQVFYRKFRHWEGIRVLRRDEIDEAIVAIGPPGRDERLEVWAGKVARHLSADAAILGLVSMYRERGGSKMGGDPAVVGFEVELVAADGRPLWKANYYERQKPMNEDLKGFIERRGVFVRAEQLTEYGVDHVLREFPFGQAPGGGAR